MTLAEALAVFGLTAVPGEGGLAAAFRDLAKDAHPDTDSGSVEKFRTLLQAKAVLEAREPGATADTDRPKCVACKGTGQIRNGAFGSNDCSRCDGTGFAPAPKMKLT